MSTSDPAFSGCLRPFTTATPVPRFDEHPLIRTTVAVVGAAFCMVAARCDVK
jgi:hypothetical protein